MQQFGRIVHRPVIQGQRQPRTIAQCRVSKPSAVLQNTGETGAVVQARGQAQSGGKCRAAQVYLEVSGDKKSTVADIQKQLDDVNIQFTTTPRNVQKYAEFMFDAGYIKTKPASWKDLYFPEIHDQPGS